MFEKFDTLPTEEEVQKILAKEADQKYRESQARESSRYLSMASHWIVSAWEIMQNIGKLREGESLVVTRRGNGGEMYRGMVKTEKLEKVPGKVPGRSASNLDRAEYHYGKFLRSKDWNETAGISTGFTHAWISAVKLAKQTCKHPLVVEFMDYAEKNPELITHEITQNSFKNKVHILFATKVGVKIAINEFGRLLWHQGSDGIIVEVK